MIRNVVVHLQGEQPMKADIESLPTAADAGLLCTNLRTMEGRKPPSTEYLDSIILVPYNVIRFIEIPRQAIGGEEADPEAPQQLPPPSTDIASPPAGPPPVGTPTPGPAAPGTPEEEAPEDEALEHMEPDEDLLRRIRDA